MPSTESPRNSSRSFDPRPLSPRSLVSDLWISACRSSPRSLNATPSRRSSSSRSGSAGRGTSCSDIAHTRKSETAEPHRGCSDGAAPALEQPGFGAQCAEAVPGIQHALGETEILDRPGDLAVLDQERAVLGQSGQHRLVGLDHVYVVEP